MPGKQIELLARGVLVRNNRLLVCRTGTAPIVYLPGGHIEYGETARTALCREISEELGCPAKAGRFLGGVEHDFIQKGRRHYEINLVFTMTIRGLPRGGVPKSAEKHLSFEWIAVNRLADARLEPASLRRCLVPWLNGRGGSQWLDPDR